MKIAIVGATGEVGRMMLTCLGEQNIVFDELDLFASAKSAGSLLYLEDKAIEVQVLNEKSLLKHYDYVLFSAGAGIALTYAPIALAACSVIIDNSSAFRREPHIPLVVPEVNGDQLEGYTGIIANPNCSTIQMILPLAVLDDLFGLTKVVVSTYQSVSGSGNKGVQTLLNQRKGGSDIGIYSELIDLNVIPQIGGLLDSGYCQEEDKMHHETRKILRNEDLKVVATTVRVPVYYGHCDSVYAEFEQKIELKKAEQALRNSESIVYAQNTYDTPLSIGNSDFSHVSRLRSGADDHSLVFWNVGHNVRLGAATNAVRILIRHAKYSRKM
ncbi:MAG: aspartate-semialdehyde dehydrogenase [Candidatus Cloacimonadaceae bacterium]|nr:aspartate-semialdehyde dehydrogenase [Candidatus Cloacimonadaceae bacterium]MDP3114173.1 aspartate-semialdehyde dehydrogenase [Candidatus Cloacimonadaceae bacterium]